MHHKKNPQKTRQAEGLKARKLFAVFHILLWPPPAPPPGQQPCVIKPEASFRVQASASANHTAAQHRAFTERIGASLGTQTDAFAPVELPGKGPRICTDEQDSVARAGVCKTLLWKLA